LKRLPAAVASVIVHGYEGTMVRAGGAKLKGIARVRLMDGTIHLAEIHWDEAHGIGKKELKLKFPFLDES
jgi:hypothetical protein